jgi:hypothetical protein
MDLPTSNSGTGPDNTNLFQKIIAGAMIAGLVYAIAMAVNAYLPTILEAMKNIYYLIFLGTPLVLLTLYIITNPFVIWAFFKTLSWNLTKFLIKMDPLSVMDRYADMLEAKRNSLEEVRVGLEGKKVKLERLIADLRKDIADNLGKGKAAMSQGENQIASLAGTKVATDQESLNLYMPIYTKMVANTQFLGELSDNWKYSIEKLRYTIDRKREEYANLKDMAKALNQADEFTNGNTEASKVYNESVKQLEITTSNYIAKIEDFEKNSKDILGNIRVERQAVQDEGLSRIEEYAKTGELMLPDFSTMLTDTSKTGANQSSTGATKKFNFN